MHPRAAADVLEERYGRSRSRAARGGGPPPGRMYGTGAGRDGLDDGGMPEAFGI